MTTTPKVEIVKNQSFQYHHILPSWNCWKWVLWKPPHPLKIKLSKTTPFKTTMPSQSGIIQNQSLQDHHIFPKWKILEISPFKTTTHSQSWNFTQSVILRQPHPPKVKIVKKKWSFQNNHILPKWKLPKITPFKTTSSKSKIYLKSVLSRPHCPMVETVKKSLSSKPPHPFKIKIVHN